MLSPERTASDNLFRVVKTAYVLIQTDGAGGKAVRGEDGLHLRAQFRGQALGLEQRFGRDAQAKVAQGGSLFCVGGGRRIRRGGQGVQGGFGGVQAAQQVFGRFEAVGQAGQQAGPGALVRPVQAGLAGQTADVVLGQPASARGERTPASLRARSPGRKARMSSALVPSQSVQGASCPVRARVARRAAMRPRLQA